MRFHFYRMFFRYGRNFIRCNPSKNRQKLYSLLGRGLAIGGMFYSSEKETISDIIKEADMFCSIYLYDNAYKMLLRKVKLGNPEVLWRLAQILCEQGRRSKNPDEKKRLFYEALEYAEKALKYGFAPGCSGAHKWYAITLNYVSELEGKKAQIAKAMEVKSHLERALELNPLDATTWHILGVWHYSFATLSTYERWGASVIYAKPPETTVEEAFRHFQRAEATNPNFYPANNYYLGLCYERLNQRDKALEELKKAFVAPVISMDDKEIHIKALEHLRKNYKINEAELMKEMK